MTAAAVLGLTILASYLIGAIPFGYLIARWRGVDILRHGSGNIGATNVGRVLGRRFGILVFLLDFAKGAGPAAAALALGRGPWLGLPSSLSADDLGVAAGLAAFLGHLFPVYLRFHGGKGVATGAGVIAVLLPGPALTALLTWVAIACATRYVSLASLAAVLALALFRLWTPEPFADENRTLTVFCLIAAGLVALRHRANITRLFRGTENRIPDSPAMLTFTKVIHLFAVGLWFGAAVFFTFVVGLSLFRSFEAVGTQPDRPAWFPPSMDFAMDDPDITGPKEQGTRAAGFAVTPMFAWYFLIQGVCGLLAVATALGWSWSQPHDGVHRIRSMLLLIALATVLAGWALERKVDSLRQPRNQAVDAFLRSTPSQAEAAKAAALSAKSTFGTWHGFSLLLNFVTLALVAVTLALAAHLPSHSGDGAVADSQKATSQVRSSPALSDH